MPEIKQLPVTNKGYVPKVQCPRSGEKTLIVTCLDGCKQFKGYDHKTKKIKCEEL
jgi:hypothetical protein